MFLNNLQKDTRKGCKGKGKEVFKDLNWRLILLGAFVCVLAIAATPYVTLKLGMSVDLTYGGMFLAAAVLGRHIRGKELAIELNIIQTMINVVSGVGFMSVILAAFYYIQVVFHRDIGFNPEWWQVFLWLLVSANLGVFMGILPRRVILDDATLPWPTGQAVKSVAETLTDPAATETVKRRRDVLTVSTAVAGFLTFLKDGLGVITPMVGNPAMKMIFSLELAAFGLGMLIPLAVGLSGVLGVWFIQAFGETTAKLGALSGTAPEYVAQCIGFINTLGTLTGAPKDQATTFLTDNCGRAMEFIGTAGKSERFQFVVQWMMWPATAMMIAAALTSVIVSLIRGALKRKEMERKRNKQLAEAGIETKPEADEEVKPEADESIPRSWTVVGITVCVLALIWLQDAWFSMSWKQVLLAVAIQPILIIAGARVLGLTGQGPVSLMANATQFLFGLIWPAHIMQNLNAAHVAADPQASSESTIQSFWVARRIGGRFRTLIIAQLIMIPIGAILLPIMFNLLERTYGIGLKEGQLSAPTGLKIASLAMVMEKGIVALPPGALTASIIVAVIGVLIELLLAIPKRDTKGVIMKDKDENDIQRFPWLPVPSAFGFALILPPPLMLGLGVGSVISAVWRKFSPTKGGSYKLFGAPIAAGLVAGEAMVGAILLPMLALILEFLKRFLP